MVKCEVVEDGLGNLIVYHGEKSIYLQTDYDIAAFGVNCGLIPAPKDWCGSPSALEVEWWEYDFEEITECPEDYWR